MIKYYGLNKRKNFFQVWYFKEQCNSASISFVPGIHLDKNGEKKAFIKVIYGNDKIDVDYNFSDFTFDNEKIKIGENEFSEDGIKVNINKENFKVEGIIKFSQSIELKKNYINSLNIINFMQCNRDVISLRHYLNGFLKVNDEKIDFIDGIGYIESVYGKRIPQEKIWIQCSDKYNYSLMISLEPRDKIKKKALGCESFVYCNGQEHRINTVKGCKVIEYNKNRVILKQGRNYLEINLHNQDDNKDNLCSLCTKSSILFKIGKRTIFNQSTDKCSYEYNIKKSV